MKVGLDASVVLRLLVGQPAHQTRRGVALLEELARRGDQPVMSDLVAAEVYFALQHHYGVPKSEALAALRRIFDEGEIGPLGAAAEVLKAPGLASAKPGFVDRLIHAGYVSNGGAMATFEKSASKLPHARVLS